ncbi:hypothetical protein ACA758_00525 [Mycoplasmopsis agassizii]|uniref:hypothetical protein n=1 Tax=Mycoplasmopsis agassizii TaxID=33922 RepID=UPI003527A6C6
MSNSLIKKFRKTNFRKYLLFSGLSILSISTFAAIACSSSNVVITEEDRRLKETGKGTDLSVKVLDNKKEIIQLRTEGYEYFTFSDFHWLAGSSLFVENASTAYGINIEHIDYKKREELEKQLDSEPRISRELFLKKDSLENIKKAIKEKRLINVALSVDDQINTDKEHKTISLVTDQTSLKKQLRVSDEEQTKFVNFIKEKVDPNLTDKQIEELKPWNSYFNYDLINKKLDLENNNYLFVKDLTEVLREGHYGSYAAMMEYLKVDRGLQIADYKIDKETKTITLSFKYFRIPTTGPVIVTADIKPYIFIGPKAQTSFLLPVDKSELSDFDFNEWTLKFA